MKKDLYTLKKYDVVEMQDFCSIIMDYGHLVEVDPKAIDEPFNKIKEAIEEIKKLTTKIWEM